MRLHPFQDQGPVVYSRPFAGQRHALDPLLRPREGQVRESLCGVTATIGDPGKIEWLAPTCPECWSRALERRDARVAAERVEAGTDRGWS